ncbi:TlyA family RNA methyltransferase [Candidatus Dependentiae bacterium]|nr:TlyA family RNA methyltransferase [Candidatus Dependentiae bacterium]
MKIKKRLDQAIQELYPDLSRNQIQSFIMQGKVLVEGHPCTKAGTFISSETILELTQKELQYVCRAGWKLAHALEEFSVDVAGLVVLDAGLSTGGFTDCLLQKGARKIYGIDVGYGQVHEKIRNDPRVIVLERTNLRYVELLPEKVDLATLDLSFISLTKVIEAVRGLLVPQGGIIALIKPQFEAARHEVGRGGVIRDPLIHKKVISHVTTAISQMGFQLQGVVESPIEGATGNKEFLSYFKKL